MHHLLKANGLASDVLDNVAADDAYQRMSGLGDSVSGADFSKLPERFFRERALATNRPVKTEWAGLEEVATFMPDAPDPTRLDMIRLAMDDLEQAREIDKRIAAWLKNDVRYFNALGAGINARYPTLADKMDRVRNARWAERLAAAIEQEGDSFVCVGIRHLAGPMSIQTMLVKLGVAVQSAAPKDGA